MTTETITGAAVVPAPSVNLMPPEIAAAQRFRRLQLAMSAVVVGALAVVGVLYVGARHSVSDAQGRLDAAQAQEAGVQHQLTQLQFVANAYQQVSNAKNLLAAAMGGEIRWSYYLEDLSLKIPDNVWLTNMAVTSGAASSTTSATPPTTGTATTTTPSVIAPADQVATITFSGVALSHDDVARWLTAIASEKGWSDPYVTSIAEATIGTTTVYDWTGTVDVTTAAQSHRYTQSGS